MVAPLTYAIGDVHGRLDLLEALLAAVRADASRLGEARPRVVLLGDYIDRGPDSRGVVELVMGGVGRGDLVALKGNHEDLMARAWRREPQPLAVWLSHGGVQTLASYGWRPGRPLDPRIVPEGHVRFLDALPTCLDDGERLFVHAGVDPRRPLALQAPADHMWSRERFLDHPHGFGRLVVHGHTIVGEEPEVLPNRVGIDTGAYASGVLTCAAFNPGAPAPRFIRAVALGNSVDKENGVVILGSDPVILEDAPWPSISQTR